jgi:ribosomal protein L11 methyltransferase
VDDDWSGEAAYAQGPDPSALEYAHPDAVALIGKLQPSGWQEEDDGHTLIFWLEHGRQEDAGALETLQALGALGELEASQERPGWHEAWKRFHKPHVVGRLHLRPPWAPARDDLLDVVVDAGLAFGTGAHATTRQVLAALQEMAPSPLLDIGCGSGVVSFAALRLGFGPVWGVDNDPQAVEAAERNAASNGLTPAFLLGDATDPGMALPAADTVVANIALRPILRLAPRFTAGAREGSPGLSPSHLLLAGLLHEQADEAAAAFPGYEVAGRREEDMWAMLHMARRR